MRAGQFPSSWCDAITIAAEAAEVRRAGQWLSMNCRQRKVPAALIERLELCLHEVLANVISHGGSAALAAPISLRLELSVDAKGGKASVTVSDAGMAFDPRSAPQTVLPKALAEVPVGGLGLSMIRRCSDWLDYRRENERNHLTFGARWDVCTPPG